MNTLTHEEMAQTEAGFGPVVIWFASAFAGAVIGGVVSGVLQDWPDFKKGVMEGYSSTVAAN